MKTVFTIIKKEFTRFFKDKRFVVTAILLPGILIYALYSMIGTITMNVVESSAEYKPAAYVCNMPESLSASFGSALVVLDFSSDEEAKSAVLNGEADVYVVFPENFSQAVVGAADAPNVEVYYNSSSENSVSGYAVVAAILDAYESAVANLFNVNAGDGGQYDLCADENGTGKYILSMVVPMVLLMLLFSGCMPVASESIAGEKERGTIATMLVTPVKRSHIAIGKIIALSVVALCSGLCSAIGLILSLPKLAGGVEMSFAMYSFADYFAILGVVLSTVLILITLISIVSAFAKSMKEANAMVIPIMVLTLLCGVFSMFSSSASLGLFFIPVFNSARVIATVLSGSVGAAAVAITICSNIVYAVLLSFVLTRMFNSEKIMFNK